MVEKLIPGFCSKQFFLYVFGGGVSAFIDVFATWLLIEMDVWYIAAVSIGFALGLLFNFLFHSKITFSTKISKSSIFRYAVIVAFNYFAMLTIIIILQHGFDINVLIGKIISLPIIALQGYLWGKYWIFHQRTT